MKAKNRFGLFAIGGMVALSMVGTAKAATVLSTGADVSGWDIYFPTGVTLEEDSATTLSLSIEKQAVFGPGTSGLVITFVPDGSGTYATNLLINDLSLTNNTGFSWTGFQELLVNTTGSATFTNTFAANDVNPWTTSTITTPTEIDFGGGTLLTQPNNPYVALLGYAAEAGDYIDINSPTGAEFFLKEIPVEATVPVPASVWIGLVGLGMVLVAKKARRVTA